MGPSGPTARPPSPSATMPCPTPWSVHGDRSHPIHDAGVDVPWKRTDGNWPRGTGAIYGRSISSHAEPAHRARCVIDIHLRGAHAMHTARCYVYQTLKSPDHVAKPQCRLLWRCRTAAATGGGWRQGGIEGFSGNAFGPMMATFRRAAGDRRGALSKRYCAKPRRTRAKPRMKITPGTMVHALRLHHD